MRPSPATSRALLQPGSPSHCQPGLLHCQPDVTSITKQPPAEPQITLPSFPCNPQAGIIFNSGSRWSTSSLPAWVTSRLSPSPLRPCWLRAPATATCPRESPVPVESPSGAGGAGLGWEPRGSSARRTASCSDMSRQGFLCSRHCSGSPGARDQQTGCTGATLLWEPPAANQTPCPKFHSQQIAAGTVLLTLGYNLDHPTVRWPLQKGVRKEGAGGPSHLLTHPHVPLLPASWHERGSHSPSSSSKASEQPKICLQQLSTRATQGYF